jgi:hypothetical protein
MSKEGAFNCSGFRILSAQTRGFIIGTVAEFRYKGHVVSMSQQGGINAHCPTIYENGVLVKECETVEEALSVIDACMAGRAMQEAAKRREQL